MVPLARAVVPGIELPPEEPAYQVIVEPVTLISARVGLVPLQKVCVAKPVGVAGVVLTVAVTANLVGDSQPFTVWLA